MVKTYLWRSTKSSFRAKFIEVTLDVSLIFADDTMFPNNNLNTYLHICSYYAEQHKYNSTHIVRF